MNIRTAKEREDDKRREKLLLALTWFAIGVLSSGPAWLHLFGSLL